MAPESPNVARLSLATQLRGRRLELGLDTRRVAGELGFTRSYLSAVENGRSLLAEDKLRDIAHLYQLDDFRTVELFALREAARRRGWWHQYADLLGDSGLQYMGLEYGASRVRTYESRSVTGLLQTAEYAEAVVASNPDVAPSSVSRIVEIRMRRQSRLRGVDPVRLMSVTDEGALHQQIGGPGVMLRQLHHLVDVIEQMDSHLAFHILPFAAGHATIGSAPSISLFEYVDEFLPTVSAEEGLLTDSTNIGNERVLDLERSWMSAYSNSLGRSESLELIRQRIRELAPNDEPAAVDHQKQQNDTQQPSSPAVRAESVREALRASGFTSLEFRHQLDAESTLAIKGLLERLVGLATELVHEGKFSDDPIVEERVERDCETLRYELFSNPDGMTPAIIAPIAQRALAAIVPVLDDVEGRDLLERIAGTADLDPQNEEAAETAIDKAQAIADQIDPQSDQMPPDLTRSAWIAGTLRWIEPSVEGVGLGAGITGTLLALGVTGPISIGIGAVLGLLALFRPKRRS